MNKLQEQLFFLEAEFKEAKKIGDWDQADYLGLCIDDIQDAILDYEMQEEEKSERLLGYTP